MTHLCDHDLVQHSAFSGRCLMCCDQETVPSPYCTLMDGTEAQCTCVAPQKDVLTAIRSYLGGGPKWTDNVPPRPKAKPYRKPKWPKPAPLPVYTG
jgi:hypothetical protein